MGDGRMAERIEKPGIYDLDDDTYHGDPCAEPSFSAGIGQIILQGAAAHAAHAHPRLGPPKDPDAEEEESTAGKFDIGKAGHALHTSKGGDLVEIAPYLKDGTPTTSKNAASWKEPAALARSLGQTPLLPSEMRRVRGLVDRSREQLLENYGYDPFGNPEQNELAIVWKAIGVGTGTFCRCKPDAIDLDHKVIWDLKTTLSYARAQAWAESQDRSGFIGLRVAHYLNGIAHVIGPGWRYRFWVVESKPPHCAVALELPGSWIERGEDQRQTALGEFAHCLATGRWKGWAKQVVIVDEPAYAEGKWLQQRDNRPTQAALEMARAAQAPEGMR